MKIRPVSDLRNKFIEIEKEVNKGEPVYLAKNRYGTMVTIEVRRFLYNRCNVEKLLFCSNRKLSKPSANVG